MKKKIAKPARKAEARPARKVGAKPTRTAGAKLTRRPDAGPAPMAAAKPPRKPNAKPARKAVTGSARRPETVNEYLANLDDERRGALEELRRTIRAAAPEAEECISYQLPTFRLNKMLVAFGATANHCTFYLMSTTVLDAFKDDLRGYATGKGSIQFRPDDPLPAALVRKLVKARIVENGR